MPLASCLPLRKISRPIYIESCSSNYGNSPTGRPWPGFRWPNPGIPKPSTGKKDRMASNLVLLSAGLDSAVTFLIAMEKGGGGAAVTVDYGQRAAAREVAKAKALCDRHGAPHIVR